MAENFDEFFEINHETKENTVKSDSDTNCYFNDKDVKYVKKKVKKLNKYMKFGSVGQVELMVEHLKESGYNLYEDERSSTK